MLLAAWGVLGAREFTVVVYNVENLFDLDGVALYREYEQDCRGPYGLEPLLGKLEAIRRTLAAFNDGAGPEVVLFQEFELDRTPYGTPDAEGLLGATRGRPLRAVLEQEPWGRDLPAELLLLKYLDDHGMGGYHVAAPDPGRMESHPPHHNVVFSRFPVRYVRQRALHEARDLLEVGLDIDGHTFIVLNNHWKSGASDPLTEPIRVQNARVVRARLDALLLENPQADILVAGDLNSHYNQRAVLPEAPETGVNCVLGAHGSESRMTAGGAAAGLYNLWFELPAEERGSEVWRGRWGTLMQMLVTPGLYDRRGIQYVDNSFGRLMVPGFNVETRWRRPVAWSNYGGGGGVSDHLPVHARFRVLPGAGEDGWMELDHPTNEALTAHQPEVPFERLDQPVPPLGLLAAMSPRERVGRLGEVFAISGPLAASGPPRVTVGDLTLEVFSPVPGVRAALDALQPGAELRAYADLEDWRGRLQLVIRHESWLLHPVAAGR